MSGSPNGLQAPWRRSDIQELPERERMSEQEPFTGGPLSILIILGAVCGGFKSMSSEA